jgi:hypothetical protein
MELEFKSIYDACAWLMYEELKPTKVKIDNKELTLLVYGNGTYEIVNQKPFKL